MKKAGLKNFAIFTGKHFCWSLNTYFEEYLQITASGMLLYNKIPVNFFHTETDFLLYKKIVLHKQASFFNVFKHVFIVTAQHI